MPVEASRSLRRITSDIGCGPSRTGRPLIFSNVVAGLYDQLDPELVFNRRAGDSIFQAEADYTWDRERDWQAGFQINLVDYPLRFIVPGNWPRDRWYNIGHVGQRRVQWNRAFRIRPWHGSIRCIADRFCMA